MTPAERMRHERAVLAASTRWAQPGSRQRQADAARRAWFRRLRAEVDPDGTMPPAELQQAMQDAANAAGARLRLAKLRREAERDDA